VFCFSVTSGPYPPPPRQVFRSAIGFGLRPWTVAASPPSLDPPFFKGFPMSPAPPLTPFLHYVQPTVILPLSVFAQLRHVSVSPPTSTPFFPTFPSPLDNFPPLPVRLMFCPQLCPFLLQMLVGYTPTTFTERLTIGPPSRDLSLGLV